MSTSALRVSEQKHEGLSLYRVRGGIHMFYIKTRIGEESALVTEITGNNVFTRCPECGAEIAVDLCDLADDGPFDLLGLGVLCLECSRARWNAAHAGYERSVGRGNQ